MPEDPRELFDEYATRYARGERPRAEEYVARAGAEADEVAAMLDRFVASAPAPAPTEDEVALVAAWTSGAPPLVELRARRGIRVDEVVVALESGLGLDPAKRAKLKRYYQRLEQGLLDPRDVSRRVFDALVGMLGPLAPEAAAWRSQVVPPKPLYWRAETAFRAAAASAPPAPAAARVEPPEEEDEVDRLFGGSRA